MVPSRKKKFWSKLFIRCVKWWIGRNFKEVNVQPFEPRPGHSILLLTNHFSWWDGFIANRTAVYDLKKQFYIMMQQDQFDQHRYFRYIGAYSIQKGSRAILDSLSYSAGILNDPDNLIVIFPQGELYSNHETHIRVETGVHSGLSRRRMEPGARRQACVRGFVPRFPQQPLGAAAAER